jgi:hypothetical protein
MVNVQNAMGERFSAVLQAAGIIVMSAAMFTSSLADQGIEPAAEQVLVQEDFEGPDHRGFSLAHHNAGDVEIHYAGVSDEQAGAGKRSFKIDVTIAGGNYVYWTTPVSIPFTHPLKIRGKVRGEGDVDVQLGYYFENPDAGTSDLVRHGKKTKDLGGGWSEWECVDPGLLQSAQPLRLQAIAVYIFPTAWRKPQPERPQHLFKNTRGVAYVDDLEVIRLPKPKPKGQVPDPTDLGDYKAYPVAAITDERILSSTPSIPEAMKRNSLKLTAARDEYESASFAVLAGKDLEKVKVSLTPLKTPYGYEITSSEIFSVKCWFLPTDYDNWLPITVLYPELLLRDDDLVRVNIADVEQSVRAVTSEGETRYFDIIRKNPDLKPEYTIEDAAALQPVDIPRFEPKQFWITVHVPPEATTGVYQGHVNIEPADAPARQLPISLTVLPFRLPAPALEYSHYYRAKMNLDGPPIISSELKTERQLEAELRDMKAYGVTNPTVYQDVGRGPDAGKALERYLTVWDRVGLSKERLFLVGAGASNELELQRSRLAMARRFGFADIYVYGSDEAHGEQLLAQRSHWQRTREAGLKVFVACDGDFDELVGDILDAPILSGPAQPDLASNARQRGHRIYMYGNPQYGVPNPLIYRRNFGLSLWKAGYHGAMDYAYQHASEWHPWNDFAYNRFPKMTYPTTSRVVGTIAWEGFREAIDDVRYVTFLLDLLDKAEKDPESKNTAIETYGWLDNLDLDRDLDAVRAEIVEKILALKKALNTE